jgi:hypothetical protein
MATWNSSFQQTPKATDSPTQGDDTIRGLAAAIEERIKNEHTTYSGDSTSGVNTADWLHKAGSAVAFYTDTEPVTRLSGEALVDGMLWYHPTNAVLYVYDEGTTTWVAISPQIRHLTIQGPLVARTNLLPVILFPRACTITKVSARVKTAPTGAAITIDFNVYNSSGVLQGSLWDGATNLSIAAAAYSGSSTSMGTYDTLAADWYMTFDIDSVGSTVAGSDLSVSIVGT